MNKIPLASFLLMLPALSQAAAPTFYRFVEGAGYGAPALGASAATEPTAERYAAIERTSARFFILEKAHGVHEALLLRDPKFEGDGRPLRVRFGEMVTHEGNIRDTLEIQFEEGAAKPLHGKLRREKFDSDSFLDGRGSVKNPPFRDLYAKPVLLVPVDDADVVAKLLVSFNRERVKP